MEDINKVPPKVGEQLNNEVLRRHRDEDMRDDDVISSDRIADSKLPATDPDEDDANLQDNDLTGRDLDVENRDEWDEENVSDELYDSDLDDDDQMIADLHSVKDAPFGSLKNSETDPAELPPEVQPKREEITEPRKDNMEHAKKNEADYKHTKEVNPPQPEHERKTTLDNLDPSNVGVEHNRKTERMVDHEPGSAGDHLAPNL